MTYFVVIDTLFWSILHSSILHIHLLKLINDFTTRAHMLTPLREI